MIKFLRDEISIFDKRIYFLFLVLAIAFITFITNEFLVNEELYYDAFSQQLSYERINEYFLFQQKWVWLAYIIIPVVYLIKFTLVAICLGTGLLLWGYKISFIKLFQIALIADSIFLIPALIKVFWFLFIQTDYTLTDLQYFYPLSILNLFDSGSLDIWFIYPLQLLNLFELLYWLVLAYGLYLILKESYDEMLKVVLSSYGFGLLLWAIFITFLNVSFS